MIQEDFFTVINPFCPEREIRIHITHDDVGGYGGVLAKPATIRVGDKGEPVEIDAQQLMEFGALCIAIAGVEGIDFSSADSLLEGFDLKGKEAAKQLYEAMEE
jgi:hypothetical protein